MRGVFVAVGEEMDVRRRSRRRDKVLISFDSFSSFKPHVGQSLMKKAAGVCGDARVCGVCYCGWVEEGVVGRG